MEKEGGEHKCPSWNPCSARYFSVFLTLSLCNLTKARGLAVHLNRVGGTIIFLFNTCLRFLGLEFKFKKKRQEKIYLHLTWLSFFLLMISSGLKCPFHPAGFFHWADHILSCRHYVVWLGSAHEMHENLGRPKWTEGQWQQIMVLWTFSRRGAVLPGVCVSGMVCKVGEWRTTFRERLSYFLFLSIHTTTHFLLRSVCLVFRKMLFRTAHPTV